MGGEPDQKVGEFLTEEQASEILHKALDDRIASLSESERTRINLETLRQRLGYC